MRHDTPLAPARYPATRGSLVAGARSGDAAERARSLERIAAAYWRPVYSHLRLTWRRRREDAEDLTQEFFARLLEPELLGAYDPARARLRTYLRACLDHLVANHDRDARRDKRGGGAAHRSLDFAAAEAELASIAATGATPEQLFERELARSLLGAAVSDLEQLAASRGKSIHFRLFQRHDLDPPEEGRRPTYDELAGELGLGRSDVTNHLAWARRELRRLVLARLREMTVSDEEFRREAQALLGIEPPVPGRELVPSRV